MTICEFCGEEIRGMLMHHNKKDYHYECHQAMGIIEQYPDKVRELLKSIEVKHGADKA